MGLIFETATPAPLTSPARADVACFVGFIQRRPAGVPAGAGEADLLLPVVVDGWNAFDALFDWAARPVSTAEASGLCATWLGAAVRSFFAAGGRRAVIVRCGDPAPLLADQALDDATRAQRLRALLGNAVPWSPLEPAAWRGLAHLFGLDEPAMVCLPDLPELYAATPARAPLLPDEVAAPEGFVECSDNDVAAPAPLLLRRLRAPALDVAGLKRWSAAVGEVAGFLSRWRRDCLFVGALPLCRGDDAGEAARQAQGARLDPLAWLDAAEPAPQGGLPARDARSAFVQLGWPWLRTPWSADLPQGLEPPDGLLAGHVAASALAQGCYRSAAGRAAPVLDAEPVPALGGGASSPWEQFSRRVCLFAPGAGAWTLVSDATTARDAAWRTGAVSRLMASVLRAARAVGQEQLFDANGPATWAAVRRAMESLLRDYWAAGGLQGATADDAFVVRCGPQTMTRADLDSGRLRVEVALVPAASVERITVVLALGDAARGAVPATELA
ncbi:hypothetical protein [Azohydromonas lata]|uniref:hypothetical protein n=1 Tax=Azohydromonas lata TaxID=45677 RepID=UPI000836D7D6|nr:hypothetical protein [Azohydromonas lata]